MSRTKTSIPTMVKIPNRNLIEERKQQAEKIRQQYPDRIPIIFEKSASSKLPDIDKNK